MGTVVLCVDLLSQAKDIETAEYRQHGKRVLKQYINNTYIYFVSIFDYTIRDIQFILF